MYYFFGIEVAELDFDINLIIISKLRCLKDIGGRGHGNEHNYSHNMSIIF